MGEKKNRDIKLPNHIMVIFPWEVDFYKKHGVNAVYYGNPFSEKYPVIENRGDKILLLPGSRKQEIQSLLPVMLEVVSARPDKEFLLRLHSSEPFGWIQDKLLKYPNLTITKASLEEAVKESEAAVAASGTVTLELALMGLPAVVIYKTNRINAFIAKNILKLGFVSLPNLTLNREVYPELLQERCTSSEILFQLNLMKSRAEKVEKDIKEIREKLSGKDVVKNYGEYILRG